VQYLAAEWVRPALAALPLAGARRLDAWAEVRPPALLEVVCQVGWIPEATAPLERVIPL